MTPFGWLLVGHMVGDWLLQTEYQAVNKAKGQFFNWALTSHCFVYTTSFVIPFIALGISFWWLIPLFWSHMFLDRRWPVIWWIKKVKRTSEKTIAALPWLVIVMDQIFHILILVVLTLLV